AIPSPQAGPRPPPRLEAPRTALRIDRRTEAHARAAVTLLLGLERDLSPFYCLAEGDPFLRTLAARFRGVKPPRFRPCSSASSTRLPASSSLSPSASACSTDLSRRTERRGPTAPFTRSQLQADSAHSLPQR